MKNRGPLLTPFGEKCVASAGFVATIVVIWWFLSPLLEAYMRAPAP